MINKKSFWKRLQMSVVIGVVMVGMVLLNIFLPNYGNEKFISGRSINSVLISILILLTVVEMRRAFGTENIPHCFSWILWLFGIGIGPMYSLFGFTGIVFFSLVVFTAAVVTALIKNSPDSLIYIASMLIYPGLFMSSMLFLNRCASTQIISEQMIQFSELDIWSHISNSRITYLLPYNAIALGFVFAVSAGTDMMAYVVGSLFGKHKLCEKVSPKKTVEGAIGGIFGGLLGALLVFLLFDSPIKVFDEQFGLTFSGLGLKPTNVVSTYIIIGLLGSVMTQVGDLLASLIKRHCGIKDYSRILGEHGGIMDRCDGIMLNSVLVSIVFMFII